MALSPLSLPAEVWTQIFGFLSTRDKFSVRASCKHFQLLVDHWRLWTDWTVVLSFRSGAYSSRFWRTLRRRKVSRVVMRSNKRKDWQQLAEALPHVSALTAAGQESLSFTQSFPSLKRLSVAKTSLPSEQHLGSNCQQLSHVSMCDVRFAAESDLVHFLSLLRNVTSLVLHFTGVSHKKVDIALDFLPGLRHLSVSCGSSGAVCRPGGPSVHSLSSLEMISCRDSSFSDDAMPRLPNLRRLTVSYEDKWTGGVQRSHLDRWLLHLPGLTHLSVTGGPPVEAYASSIPASVTRLTLRVPGLSSRCLAAIAERLPGLLHLHVDLWPFSLGARTAQIPQLFPQLRRLALRRERVSEQDFLQLRGLQHLESLEILDGAQAAREVAAELGAPTKHRVRVSGCSHRPGGFLCACALGR